MDAQTWNVLRLLLPHLAIDKTVVGSDILVHLRPHQVLHYADLTKAEIGRIASGYPPWYQESLLTSGGLRIPYPCKTLDDVARGGWIVAIGLSSQKPIDSFMLLSPSTRPAMNLMLSGPLCHSEAVLRAALRVKEHIEELSAACPDDESVQQLNLILNCFSKDRDGTWSLSGITPSKLEAVMAVSDLYDERRDQKV